MVSEIQKSTQSASCFDHWYWSYFLTCSLDSSVFDQWFLNISMAFGDKKLLNSQNRGFHRDCFHHVHGQLLSFQTQIIQFVWSLLQGLWWSIANVRDCELFKSGSCHCAELFWHDENGLIIQGSDGNSWHGIDWRVDHQGLTRNFVVDGLDTLFQCLGTVDECSENWRFVIFQFS